jgi:hypothetical protein
MRTGRRSALGHRRHRQQRGEQQRREPYARSVLAQAGDVGDGFHGVLQACARVGAAAILAGAARVRVAFAIDRIDSRFLPHTTGATQPMSTVIGIVLLVLFLYLAIKVVGFALKAAFILGLIAVGYWLLAPMLGLPLP